MILQGDALTVLREMAADSFDALVTDPPAGIGFMGKEWDTFGHSNPSAEADREAAYDSVGKGASPFAYSRSGRSPGDRERFIAFLAEVMAECLRVLKPGAHGLVWAIPRTSHWTATALEDAGFEVRDVITHHFGTGFPKSLDVSKAIDKAAGAERKVIGPNPKASQQPGQIGTVTHGDRKANLFLTGPATDGAAQWRGWGTALKPASEHWILVRKPLTEATVAANVLRHGTGALNIDRTRIGYRSPTDQASAIPQGRATALSGALAGRSQNDTETTPERSQFKPDNTKGRWPANLILSHSEGCKPVGTRKVSSSDPRRADGTVNASLPFVPHGGAASKGMDKPSYADPDGTETIEAWECVEGCPVAELDRQSGERGPGGNLTGSEPTASGFSGAVYGSGKSRQPWIGGDAGGASRFFYVAKASTAERNVGLEGAPLRASGMVSNTSGQHITRRDGGAPGPKANHHPTVKALALMRYLCRLVTPPGGTVLDPFMGSGSTGVAAIREGFDFVGIERERDYFEIAEARILAATNSRESELFPEEAA